MTAAHPEYRTPPLGMLFDLDLLAGMLEQRYVKTQHHPTEGLRILNYTQHAQFERVWNPVTLACRGLIVDPADRIVARPFPKFFNLADHPVETLPAGDVLVTEKLDGSLGILYPVTGGHAIATRGSFTSEQATHATRVWQDRYASVFVPRPGWTYLFEILYPGNRIVVDYAGLDDLVLLGAVDLLTGVSVPLADAAVGWPGPVVTTHPVRTLAAACALPAQPNSEGFVLHFVATDLRVKLKHEEYVRLHRLVTDVSERRIWEALSSAMDLTVWLDAVPDECFEFVVSVRDRLTTDFQAYVAEVEQRFEQVLAELPAGWSRREFAAAVTAMTDFPLAKALFSRLDGKDYTAAIWQVLRPVEHQPRWGRSEDVG